MKNKTKNRFFSRSNWKLVVLVLLLLLVGTVLVLELTGTTYIFHKRQAVSGTIPSSSTQSNKTSSDASKTTSDQQKPSSSTSAADTSSEKAGTATSDSTAPLVAPYGSFVSNHKPSYSGVGGVPSQEQSVCITTPGATCYITFVSAENIAKKLEPKVADSKGAVYWDWDVKTAGFTVGVWKITATANLNGQNMNTNDSLDLTVNP